MGAFAHRARRRPSPVSSGSFWVPGRPRRAEGKSPSQALGSQSRAVGGPSQALRPLVAIVLAALLAALLVGYRPSLAPPGLHSRNVALGAAQAEVLVDTKASQLATATPVNPNAGKLVAEQAVSYALYLQSDHATAALGEALGLHGLSVSASGPFTLLLGRENLGPKLPTPPNPILVDNAYRLLLDVDGERPMLSIYAQAPSVRGAVALVDAARALLLRHVRAEQSGGPVGPETVVAAPARADHRRAGGRRRPLADDGVRVRARAAGRPQLPLRPPPSAPARAPHR